MAVREVVLRARVARATKGSEVLLRGWRGRRQQRKGGWVGGVGVRAVASSECAKAWRGLEPRDRRARDMGSL